MNRLHSELNRLYLPTSQRAVDEDVPDMALIDGSSRVRAMVIELTRAPSWELLSRIWHGVQADLDLPAPAIAVSGIDGLQLWFSLENAVPAAQAHAFLESLRRRYVPEVEPTRFRLMPSADASALRPELHARMVPALQASTGNWSAFVARDLASVFGDAPWLDIPPNEEGQAVVLHRLESITPKAFESASRALVPRAPDSPPAASAAIPAIQQSSATKTEAANAPETADVDPKRFLQRVMNDDSVALALRIEAAKALLQHPNG